MNIKTKELVKGSIEESQFTADIEQDGVIDDSINDVVEFRYAITSYGADYDVNSIVKRVNKGTIIVPPFQRKYVWNLSQASKFIESLILGLPVPGIFLSKEKDSAKYLIVDGQQRIQTLQKFYDGIFNGKEFALTGVQKDLESKTYKTLSIDDQTRLDDSIIRATIIKQDTANDNDSSYTIFERLNNISRTPLRPQEIRACIFYGAFNEYLSKCTENDSWRLIYGKPNTRMKEEELILRFFALYYEHPKYQKPLKTFLNSFISRNRDFGIHEENKLNNLFIPTVEFIADSLGKDAFRPDRALNAAVFDSVMIATANYVIEESDNLDKEKYKKSYYKLLENEEFKAHITRGTSDENSVSKRIGLAIHYLSDIQ